MSLQDLDAFLRDEAVDLSLEYYPGSKRKRRRRVERVNMDRVPVEEWGKPVKKLLKGQPVELWPVSGLAIALGKSMVSIRLYERQGYLPKAPFRLRPQGVEEGKPEASGRRYYSKELIDAAVDEFAARNLLGAARVEWSKYPDLPVVIAHRWKEIIENL